jgi:hypothetical protein
MTPAGVAVRIRPTPRPSSRRRPAPFSSEWVAAQAAPRRRLPAVPTWVPSERRLAALLVLAIAAARAVAG